MTPDLEPFVTVVIPCHNRAPMLDACLASLAAQEYPRSRWETIVVDDGSEDETAAVVSRHEMMVPLKILRHDERRGSGPARNTALRDARGDILIFIDSDTLAPPWFIDEHVRSHRGRRCFVDGPAINVRHDACAPTSREWGADTSRLRAAWVELQAWLDVAGAEFVTVNVSCRRADILAAGGFDENFGTRWGWEDTELGLRMRALGVARVKNRKAYVLHRHVPGYDWRDRGRKKEQAGVNAVYFFSRHPTSRVARLTRGRPALARVLAAVGMDADRIGRAFERGKLPAPVTWSLGQVYEIQKYQRGVLIGSRLRATEEAMSPGRDEDTDNDFARRTDPGA